MTLTPRNGRKRRGFIGRAIYTVGAFGLFVRDGVVDDLRYVLHNGRLFLGIVLTAAGMLSFASGRYCDATSSAFQACTRSATYYYYPWWAIALVVIGVSCIVVWRLRDQRTT